MPNEHFNIKLEALKLFHTQNDIASSLKITAPYLRQMARGNVPSTQPVIRRMNTLLRSTATELRDLKEFQFVEEEVALAHAQADWLMALRALPID